MKLEESKKELGNLRRKKIKTQHDLTEIKRLKNNISSIQSRLQLKNKLKTPIKLLGVVEPVSKDRQPLKQDGYNTNLASEYHVLSMLYRLGLNAYLTLGNKKSIDIIIENKKGVLTVDVKGMASGTN